MTGTLFLKDNTTLVIEKNAHLLASKNLLDYPKVNVDFRFWGDEWVYYSLIVAHNVNNVTIKGEGIIDGRGDSFPVITKKKPDRYRNRPYLLWFAECESVVIRDVELRNSAMWMQSYIRCNNLKIDGIKVYNQSNKNNDLMDIDGCKDVIITNVVGDSDDDGITFKSTTDRICENVTVSNCIISSHCNALKFGTETTTGFRNIAITNCVIRKSKVRDVITGCAEGICGIALEIVDGGIMENITISNIVIDGPRVPFFIRLGNRARKHYKEAPDPPIGSIHNVIISNIIAKASSPIGCSITGITEKRIKSITLSNSRFVCVGGIKDNIEGIVVEELKDEYPESTMFGVLPSYGLYIRHAENINIHDIDFILESEDKRPAIICDDVIGGSFYNIVTDGNNIDNNIKILSNSSINVVP